MAQESIEGTFRAIVKALRAIASDGLHYAPTGHFAIVEIPEDESKRKEMRRVVFQGDNETFDGLDAGWYFVVQSSPDSLTYDKCESRDYALARFSLARAAYIEWMNCDWMNV